MRKDFLLVLLGIACILACKRRPDVQGKGVTALQGTWEQDTIPGARQLLSYSTHKFKFTCDSFYLTLTTHAKVNYYADSCFKGGSWTEYAKGTYAVKKDTLLLTGLYTKPNFKQKISGCFNSGQYLQNYYLNSIEPKRLIIENLGNQQEATLHLKESLICKPKSF